MRGLQVAHPHWQILSIGRVLSVQHVTWWWHMECL